MYAGSEGRLGDQQADQVVLQQMNPHYFLRHHRRAATKDFHSQSGFYVPDVQLNIPASLIQVIQLTLAARCADRAWW